MAFTNNIFIRFGLHWNFLIFLHLLQKPRGRRVKFRQNLFANYKSIGNEAIITNSQFSKDDKALCSRHALSNTVQKK